MSSPKIFLLLFVYGVCYIYIRLDIVRDFLYPKMMVGWDDRSSTEKEVVECVGINPVALQPYRTLSDRAAAAGQRS